MLLKSWKTILILFFIKIGLTHSSPITVCYETADYSPYSTSKSEDGKGLIIDLVEISLSSLKLEFNMIRRPWKRCINLLKKNKIDAIFPALWTQEREQWASFPTINGLPNKKLSIWSSYYSIFVHVDSKITYKNGIFNNLELGLDAPAGYVVYNMLKDMKVLTKRNNKPDKAFDLIAHKRIDGYIIEEKIGKFLLRKTNNSKLIKTLEEKFLVGHWYIAFSRKFFIKNKKLTKQIWQSLNDTKVKHGKKLLNKYNKNQSEIIY